MINGISSYSSAMSMMSTRSMGGSKPPPPPPEEDLFQISDSDSDGTVSQTELETLVSGIEEVTGESLDVSEALDTYDADEDGTLNGEELRGMLENSGFVPPVMSEPGQGGMERMDSAQVSVGQAMSAYAQNSGENSIQQLMEFMRDQTGVASSISMSI